MKKYHFIGIGGIGMSALADLLLERKMSISGSDLNLSEIVHKLENKGAVVSKGHHAETICSDQIVVYSSAVKKTNPEYEAALKLGCAMIHRSELLAQLAEEKTSIAITGTHGKTTTSSLLSYVLLDAGKDPSFALGGLLEGRNGRNGASDLFVFEADESDGSFLRYHPNHAIITNIEAEHLNYFGSLQALQNAFKTFALQVTGHLFYCGDALTFDNGISYGFNSGCDLHITQWRQEGWKLTFDCTFEGKNYADIQVPLIGEHNVANSAAVFGMALKLGVEESAIREALQSFPGISRRCQLKKVEHGVTFLDDYAHHPTEIVTTLQGIASASDGRRLVVLFQPHRYTRTQENFEAFANSFKAADVVFISDIYAAGEDEIPTISGKALAEAAAATYLPKERWSEIEGFLRPHDIFVTMGAGDVTSFTCHPKVKYCVGVIYGGRSPEHEVSKNSGACALSCIDRSLYDVQEFFIDKEGKWNGKSLFSSELLQALEKCDVFVPVLHGTNGEDGTMQGFFEILQKPYTGPAQAACALAMDKHRSKVVAQAAGVPTPKWFAFTAGEWQKRRSQIIARAKQMHFPLFVKANHQGSSIGTSKVSVAEELEQAIESSFECDYEVLIEEGVERARELEFAVMGNDDVEVPTPGEKLAQGAFVDYKMKYTKGMLTATVTPEIDSAVLAQGKKYAEAVYRAIGSRCHSRVDFFLDPNQQWWFFEINSLPGMQPLSLFPKVWEREGVSYQKMLDKMIILALQRSRAWAF